MHASKTVQLMDITNGLTMRTWMQSVPQTKAISTAVCLNWLFLFLIKFMCAVACEQAPKPPKSSPSHPDWVSYQVLMLEEVLISNRSQLPRAPAYIKINTQAASGYGKAHTWGWRWRC